MRIETTTNGVTIHANGQVIKCEPATLQQANALAAAFRAAHKHIEQLPFVGGKRNRIDQAKK